MADVPEFDYHPYTLPHGTPEWTKIQSSLQKLEALDKLENLRVVLGELRHVANVNVDPTAAAQLDPADLENFQKDDEEECEDLECENLLLAGVGLIPFYPDLRFIELLQNIATLALDIEKLFKEKVYNGLQSGENGSISFTRAQVRCLNAHAFLGTLRYKFWKQQTYQVTFTNLFAHQNEVACARLKCMLCYFHETLHSEFEPDQIITYARRCPESTPDWENATNEFQEVQVFDDTLIENQPASCQLDFANKHLHIASIIPSATQEEVVFSIRPECFPAMLFMDSMDNLDSIVLGNVQRYCKYTGYQYTFEFDGPFKKRTEENEVYVLAIDAVINIYNKQFQPEKMLRDLNKAYSGFSHEYPDEWISTGMWGCGVFNGDPILKFMQQMMVAAVCEKKMFYSCYLNEELSTNLQQLGDYMRENMTVKDVWNLIQGFDTTKKRKFHDYAFIELGLQAPEPKEAGCSIS